MHNPSVTISREAEHAAPSRAEAIRGRSILCRSSLKRTLLVVSDLLAISAAHWLAGHLTSAWPGAPFAPVNPLNNSVIYASFFAVTAFLVGAYKNPGLRRPEKELELVSKAVTLYFVALTCANLLFLRSHGFSRYLLVAWYALSLALILAVRFSLRGIYAALWKRGLARQRMLFAGSQARWEDFQRHLAIQRYAGYELAGLVTGASRARTQTAHDPAVPILGAFEDVEEIAERSGADVLLVCSPVAGGVEEASLYDLARGCRQKGIELEVCSELFAPPDFEFDRDEFSGCLRFMGRPWWPRAVQRAAMRCVTFGFGVIGSLIALLVTPVVALLLKWEDGGPVFYRREFVDCDGQTRHYLKFRSMVQDADRILRADGHLKQRFDAQYKLERDPRVLRAGRFLRKYSMDELPQFFSVLTGQLALVGPRVICQEEARRYEDCLPRLLSVKPGLTGYWQVMGRQTTTYEERIQMDMFYIEHWSIWLDLVIIGKTFWKVLRAEGAY